MALANSCDHELGEPFQPPLPEDAPSEVAEQALEQGSSSEVKRAEPKAERQPIGRMLNLLLCLVTLFVGLLMPTMVDMSRTATQYEKGGKEGSRCLPYTTASVVMAEALVNVLIGGLRIVTRDGLQALRDLVLNCKNHRSFVGLTLTYCLGDVVALCAIGRGGGLLFLSMSNSRLLFAAIASRYFLPRKHGESRKVDKECLFEWFYLVAISGCVIWFAVSTSRGQDAELRRGTLSGSGLALLKAGLSAVAAVLTELRLKHDKFDVWQANTLLKMQSLLVALLVCIAQFMYMEDLCPEDKDLVKTPCVDKRGWDVFTSLVLFAEVGNGWLQVAILKRMSAVVKFVCKAAAAPSLYTCYALSHFRDHRFEWDTFLPIAFMTAFICLYTEPERCLCCWKSRNTAEPHEYTPNYRALRTDKVGQSARP